MAMIPKPKEHDLQKRERAIIVIFGEEQDPINLILMDYMRKCEQMPKMPIGK
ncbi:hypothetical protein TWF106_010317 [Orbilia oligospora]|uniref:Uncharacterized protein n=1 Tax=Orbilia oligospora TaxID=2813651 RepID=A0A7C8UKF2_ORBOL|nr:hypothetical protein TWF106_010317 [Orbilia oligospora]